ncbi:hypothetical protein [Alteromonas flava]|uniref:hypothetical protein n=1 Tax=Alteromonas flava TaxID=2048003 RepID=UPI000C28C675|nr:hypothetical protein [Alteromonas flava]
MKNNAKSNATIKSAALTGVSHAALFLLSVIAFVLFEPADTVKVIFIIITALLFSVSSFIWVFGLKGFNVETIKRMFTWWLSGGAVLVVFGLIAKI